VRAKVWHNMGGLDESLDNLYPAMNDFCVRATKAGDNL